MDGILMFFDMIYTFDKYVNILFGLILFSTCAYLELNRILGLATAGLTLDIF